MACEISRPSPQALFDRQRDMFSSTVLNGAPVIPESVEWYVVSLNYAVAEELYAFSEQQWKERDPRFACCENLMKIAAQNGVHPYPASFAQGYVRITGDPGAALPSSIEIDIGDGKYVTEGSLPSIVPPEGSFVVRVRSETAGQQGNGRVPATGTISEAIADVETTVDVFGGFCGGEDAETCEQFRSRYLNRLQIAPNADAAWIEQKLLEWPCATRVCVRSGSCCTATGTGGCSCGSSLGYYVFFDNTFEHGVAPQCVIDELNEWMFGPPELQGYGMGQVEVGVCGQVYPLQVAIIDITISDYGCISNSQKNEIRARMSDFFKTLCPSTEINQNQFEAIVGSVLGFANTYAVELTPVGPGVSPIGAVGCGYELDCDYAAGLGSITFIDTVPEQGAC